MGLGQQHLLAVHRRSSGEPRGRAAAAEGVAVTAPFLGAQQLAAGPRARQDPRDGHEA